LALLIIFKLFQVLYSRYLHAQNAIKRYMLLSIECLKTYREVNEHLVRPKRLKHCLQLQVTTDKLSQSTESMYGVSLILFVSIPLITLNSLTSL